MDIFKNYQNSLKDYQTEYKSNHWKKFDLRLDLFKNENLKNFRNNGLSDGLDDRYSLKEQKKIYKDLVDELGENYVFKYLNDRNVGNSLYCYKYKNKYIDGGQNFHIKWLNEIEKYLDPNINISSVCEIGGGYGSFGEKLIKAFNCKYVSIDLPEANYLASYYLKENFLDKSIIGVTELNNGILNKDIFDQNQIFILNPWNKINDIKFDLIINARSMMEMDTEIINNYFDFIHRYIKKSGYFLNINRYRKKSVCYPIHLYEYPYDNNWEVVVSKKSWRQSWVHFLLTKRIEKNFEVKKTIQEELVKIKKVTRYFILKEKLIDFKKIVINNLKKIIRKILFIK